MGLGSESLGKASNHEGGWWGVPSSTRLLNIISSNTPTLEKFKNFHLIDPPEVVCNLLEGEKTKGAFPEA